MAYAARIAAPEVLQRLLTAAGPSGHEGAPAAAWREAAGAFAAVEGDLMGSSTARVVGTAGGPTLAVIGHIDEIGLIVTHVDDKGFLVFAGIGGWDPQILVGQRVQVLGAGGPVPGVIGKKPIHLLRDEERKKVVELRDLHIDIGASSADEAREAVRVGDVAVLAGDPVELHGGRLASRALDNRLGAFIALEATRLVAQSGGAPGDVVAVAGVQEEITMAGAGTTAYRLQPDAAIVVDVTHASDAPGIDVREVGEHPLGSGAVIARGATLHPAVSGLLLDAARDEGIAHTVEATTGRTGTDADAVHLNRGGIPTGMVSIPLRYMHSPVEVVQLSDIEACAALVAAFARRLGPSVAFTR
ncbi:MAG TPA: M20/M25/M40 family metallo-hydrolase [Solirubrobacteraceae bacterium]|nr:M20/M25/M40 family metallo-hydrolase [Solirubrobacteraceae bacterium]